MNLRTKLRIKLNGDLKESNLMLDFRGKFLVAILDFFDEWICFRWGMAKAQVCGAGEGRLQLQYREARWLARTEQKLREF